MIQRYGKAVAGVAALLLVASAVSVFVPRSSVSGVTPRERLLELRHCAFGSPILGRLSGEKDILPISPDLPKSAIELDRALAGFRMATAAPQLEGLRRLLQGRVDEAVRLLSGGGPGAANDLAVAYLTRGQGPQKSLDLLAALETLEEAAKARPRTPEIAFNRAVVLQSLHLRTLAARAFEDFLKLEPQGRWAEVARRKVTQLRDEPGRLVWERLKERLVRARPAEEDLLEAVGFPFEARELCEGIWLQQAGIEALAGKGDSAIETAESANRLAKLLAEKWHDRLLLEASQQLVEQLRGGDPRTIQSAGQALSRYFAGLDHSAHRRYRSAAEALRVATADLQRLGSPLALKAELATEIALHYGDVAASAQRIAALCPRIPEAFPELQGRCRWMLGIALGAETRFEESAQAYLEARDLIDRTSGGGRAANLDLLLAENLDGRGEVARAWTYRRRAFSILAYQNDAHRRYGALIEAAQALGRNQKPGLALVFLDEAQSVIAEAYNQAYAHADVELEIAANRLRLGEADLAIEHLGKARSWIATLEPSAFRDRLEAQGRLVQGLLLLTPDPKGAYAEFRAAEESARRSKFRFQELPLLLALASAQESSGNGEAQRQTLARAVQALERVRRNIQGLAESSESFRRARGVFDRLISVEVNRQDPAEAFAWAERSRGQATLDRWRRGSSETSIATFEEVAAGLGVREVLLEFVVADDRLLCWVFAQGRAKLVPLAISRPQLAGKVDRFVDSLANGASVRTLREQGAGLHRDLIEPLGLDLEPGTELVVVADDPVRQIPFAALVDDTGAYLAERAMVSSAPSATLYLLARDKGRHSPAKLRALVVGLGEVTGGPYSELRRLPEALREAKQIAGLVPGSLGLFDQEATRGRLRELLGAAEVLHFSGHGIAAVEKSDGSALVLTPSGPGDDGLMRLADLEALPARRLRLVTLSACETLRGYDLGREGGLSLAEAFFAAGVPAVVGTRWEIDDATSAALMEDFYRAFQTGERPAVALHRARQTSIRSNRPLQASPVNWAAFELVGW